MGYQICFYLSLTALACAWHFRTTVYPSLSPDSFTRVIWPFISGSFLIFVFAYSVLQADRMTNIIGLGGIILGIIPLFIRKVKN